MALEKTGNAYEQLYEGSAPEDKDKYYDGYVEMKEGFMVCCE